MNNDEQRLHTALHFSFKFLYFCKQINSVPTTFGIFSLVIVMLFSSDILKEVNSA